MHIFEFKGLGGCRSICGFDAIVTNNKTIIVLLTELPENPGTSITNSIEALASRIKNELLSNTPAEKVRWIEYYPATFNRAQSFDEVSFQTFKAGTYSGPSWQRLDIRSIVELRQSAQVQTL